MIKRGSLVIAASRIGCSEETYQKNRGLGLKWCWYCQRWHHGTEFGKNPSKSDGMTSLCKRAISIRQKARYVPKPKRPLGRQRKPTRSGDKRQAIGRINYLVRVGIIPPPWQLPCTDCGHIGDGRDHEYDHYLGYSAEHHLDVQSVCTKCHGIRTVGRGERPKPPLAKKSERCRNGHPMKETRTGDGRCGECEREYHRKYWVERKKPRLIAQRMGQTC